MLFYARLPRSPSPQAFSWSCNFWRHLSILKLSESISHIVAAFSRAGEGKSISADWHKSIQMYVNPNDGLCKSWTEYKFSFCTRSPEFLWIFFVEPHTGQTYPLLCVAEAKGMDGRSECDICKYSIMPSTLVCLIHSTRFYVNTALGVLLLLTQEEIFKSIRPEEYPNISLRAGSTKHFVLSIFLPTN